MRTARQRRLGFTLVEILVACVLLLLLMGMLFSVFSNITDSYQYTESRASSFRDGRAAVRLMTQDLEGLVDISHATTNSNQATLPRISIGSGTANPSFGFVSRASQAAQPDTNAISDICLIGYFIADNTNLATPGRALYRVLIPSDQTYTRLVSGDVALIKDSDLKPDATLVEPVADNVIDFSIKVFDADYIELSGTNAGVNARYVQINLTMIGSRLAGTYFAPGCPDSVKQRIRNHDSKSFELRSRLRINLDQSPPPPPQN